MCDECSRRVCVCWWGGTMCGECGCRSTMSVLMDGCSSTMGVWVQEHHECVRVWVQEHHECEWVGAGAP